MPTGYTADVAKGISFQQFALNCARAFGACILMRDDPADKPIPDSFSPTDYHLNAMAAARDNLSRLRSLTAPEADTLAAQAFEKQEIGRLTTIREHAELRKKYSVMLLEAKKWNPPTPEHNGLRDFMVKQLEESINFDCSDSYYATPTMRLGGAEWLAHEITEAERLLQYHECEHAEELSRTRSRNQWIADLRKSLLP